MNFARSFIRREDDEPPRTFEFPQMPKEGPKLSTILEDNVPEK